MHKHICTPIREHNLPTVVYDTFSLKGTHAFPYSLAHFCCSMRDSHIKHGQKSHKIRSEYVHPVLMSQKLRAHTFIQFFMFV